MTVAEVLDFFVTNTETGLSAADIESRYKKFGHNKANCFSPTTQGFYSYKTLRSGTVAKIESDKLVLGDILLLKKGDVAPADLRLLKVKKFSVTEDAITGNAGNTLKNTFIAKTLLPKEKQKNMVFGGSVVATGEAIAIIVNYSDGKQNKPKRSPKPLKDNNIYSNYSFDLAKLKQIDAVVFDDLRQEWEVIKSFQKVYLEKGIDCYYLLNDNTLERLKTSAPEAEIINPEKISKQSNGVVFVNSPNESQKTKTISKLTQQGKKVLYVYRGEAYEYAASAAELSLVITPRATQLAMYSADMLTNKLNINSLASILYNKK